MSYPVEGKNKFIVPTQLIYCMLLAALALTAGCATVSSSDSIGIANLPNSTFKGKKIALLPVQSQTSLTTDSISSLKVAINNLLPRKMKEKFTGATIVGPGTVMEVINKYNEIKLLSNIMESYDETGYTPRKAIKTLGRQLHCNYLVFSRLKAEKMDLAWAGKGFGASLEVLVIDTASNKIIEGGVAQFKRGGFFGTGGTNNSEAAQELVRLAMEKL